MSLNIAVIFLALIFSAFFSGMEIAFISANRLKIELDKKQKKFSSGLIDFFTRRSGQYISTMLVGNNIALVIYGIFFAKLLAPLIQNYISDNELVVFTVQTVLSTILILFTAEFLPKTIFRRNANFLLQRFAMVVMIFYVLFYPVAVFSMRISQLIIRLFSKGKIEEFHKNQTLRKIDLDHFLSENEDQQEEDGEFAGEVKLFRNALDFSEIKIRACIVPRNEIVAESIDTSLDDLRKKFIESGFSKIFIYKDNIDNILGYVHTLSIFKKNKTIKSALTTVPVVPESMPADKLLNKFLQEHKSVALVVDEFGGTSGIVTMEDIIEEILGEIEDEHDEENKGCKKISETEYILSGRAEIDFINEKFKLNLPESEEYETLAGYILQLHEQIPAQDEVLETENFTFEMIEINTPKIERVRLIIH